MNTATSVAIPNTPPSWRIMLNVPEALPRLAGVTELTTAFWIAGIAIETPQPAIASGATSRQ